MTPDVEDANSKLVDIVSNVFFVKTEKAIDRQQLDSSFVYVWQQIGFHQAKLQVSLAL